MSQGSEVCRGVIFPYSTLILTKGDIQDPVKAVLNAPVAPNGLGYLFGIALHARDVVAELQTGLAVSDSTFSAPLQWLRDFSTLYDQAASRPKQSSTASSRSCRGPRRRSHDSHGQRPQSGMPDSPGRRTPRPHEALPGFPLTQVRSRPPLSMISSGSVRSEKKSLIEFLLSMHALHLITLIGSGR